MLETALLSTRSPARAHAVRVSLPAILALHGAVLAGFVATSAWSEGEPPEPTIPIVFGRFFSPPPPKGAESHGLVQSHSAGPKAPAAVPIRIERIPDLSRDQPTHEEAAGAISDSIGGDLLDALPGAGSSDGVPGAVGEASARGDGGGDDLPRPGGAISYPALVQRIDPEYPDLARRARQEGTVILDAVITTTGGVEDVTVLKSAGPLLDDAAARAVRRWSYRPALLAGRAVRVRLTVTVTFALRGA